MHDFFEAAWALRWVLGFIAVALLGAWWYER